MSKQVLRKFQKKTSRLPDIILGGQDGLVNVLGLLLGLAAATSSNRVILAGGLAATFAETLSMAAVAYTSRRADQDHYEAERARELREIKETPEDEIQDVRDIYANKGFGGPLLEEIVAHITSDEDRWVDSMMEGELSLLPTYDSEILSYSLTVGMSTFVGSVLPLISFMFLPVRPALAVALMVSVASLAAVGLYRSRVTLVKPAKSVVQIVVIGMGAAIAGYLIGLLFRS
jgi:VIT1/CCC1 family predicted Fe2+/Mn2+ transporter